MQSMKQVKISVLTPSVRSERLQIVSDSLKKQKFQDYEWIIGTRNLPDNKDFQTNIWCEDNFSGGFWSLNRTYNKLIGMAKGELFVSWQDSIYIPPDGLQKFWDAYQAKGNCCFSGIGNQYAELNQWGKPHIQIWQDPRQRKDLGSFYECTFPDIEYNWCAIPKKLLYDIGGFDEKLDFLGFGMDGYSVNERLNDAGCHFYLDQDNVSYTLQHDRSAHGGEKNWNKFNNLSNGEYHKRREELKKAGMWPRLKYL